MTSRAQQRLILNLYFLATWLILLGITQSTLDFSAARTYGPLALAFLFSAWLSYCGLFLLPALLITRTTAAFVNRGRHDAASVSGRLIYPVAVFTGAATTLFFYANAKLHTLYGIFVNGFVINLIVTPGGLASLGGSDATNLGFALIAAGFLLAHGALLALIWKIIHRRALSAWRPAGLFKAVVVALLLSLVADRGIYAYSDAFGRTDMLALSEDVPFYTGLTARKLFRKMGFKVDRERKLAGVKAGGHLNYPAHPLQTRHTDKPYNIVWLVAESWRADTLTQDIMPATKRFAEQAQHFTNHYSGGNGTRIGVFTMFTGIPGTYWDAFLKEHRGAAIIDILKDHQYQMSFYTSAAFTYPEFDKTIFSQVPKEQLHQIDAPMEGWQKDRLNVQHMLEFIDSRDASKPFFTFMFFESPHARYYFPPESVIRKPYMDDINYATLSKEALVSDMPLIKNRYLNSVHHLDSQLARVFDHLRENNLLDNTIVVVTGDHGEEFMEHGFWGHNSTFSDQQVRPPLVLWIPDTPPAVHDKLSSHMDIVATLMPKLGVTNPPADYTVGIDLMSSAIREHVDLSDWSRMGYVDQITKITLPMNMKGIGSGKITGANDQPLNTALAQEAFEREQPHLVRMMQEFGQFTSK